MYEPLTVCKANAEETTEIYNTWMKQQFHQDELKSLHHIEVMCARGEYAVYGMWEGENLLAYALLGRTVGGNDVLLDYYAVLPQYQDRGYGGVFLGKLREKLEDVDNIIIEVENPEFAQNPQEKEKEQRRIRFYEKNACEYTDIRVNLFGFEYVIMVLPVRDRETDDAILNQLSAIYHVFFPKEVYQKYVKIRREA